MDQIVVTTDGGLDWLSSGSHALCPVQEGRNLSIEDNLGFLHALFLQARNDSDGVLSPVLLEQDSDGEQSHLGDIR
jgi:hypothetical protein